MSTGVASKTVDDLSKLPEDNLRHELVDGELRTTEPTGFEHRGAAAGFILRRAPDTVRAPDAAFVSAARVAAAGPV